MKTTRGKKMLNPLVILLLLGVLALILACPGQGSPGKVSDFGKYQGYTEKVYDGYKRLSDYMALSDGTQLAYDLILPTKNGLPADKPLPTLFHYTGYGRAWTVYDKNGNNSLAKLVSFSWDMKLALRVRSRLAPNGNVLDPLWRTKWLEPLVKSGYAVVVVERPGTGASFGRFDDRPEAWAREIDELLNWVAAQPWCDGNIGMYGDSWHAQVQFIAATTGNPHLKAILPATTWMDNYSVMFPGGVLNKAFAERYAGANEGFDAMATPVDRDKEGTLLAQVRAERGRAALTEGAESVTGAEFRDALTPGGENYWIDHMALYPFIERINRSGVPAYLINGWYDLYARDNFLIYANLTVPKRLLVRPTDHSNINAPAPDIDYAAEAQRWFDYWLKGIDNGIMREPPIHYYMQGVGKQVAWDSAEVWPPTKAEMKRYYFGAGQVGVQASINNGTLVPSSPTSSHAVDSFTVDYTTTTGNKSRWTALAEPHQYPNLRSNDARALTYTTLPLDAVVRVIGHPVVHVWLGTSAPDLDVFAYLEKVDRNGNSTYITEGNLRASRRSLNPAPFDNLGLPWHNYYESEVKLIPAGEPIELVFDLLPTAYEFSEGDRIRITITFADADNFDTPILNPVPDVQLFRNASYPSYVEIPIVQDP